jgi:hypothetical protein
VLVAKAIANLIPESNASQWQAALSESLPVRCFRVLLDLIGGVFEKITTPATATYQ